MEMVCIVCPNGCKLQVTQGEEILVEGAKCPRGKKYAETELIAPTRSVTTTVKTVFADVPVLSVRTDGEIPKAKIFDLMKEINGFVLRKRVKRGDVVIENALGLGVNVIATSGRLTEDE